MIKRTITFLLILFCGFTAGFGEEELADDYLTFTLKFLGNKLEGGCVHLEGFKVSMNLPGEFIKKGFTIDDLKRIIANHDVTGEVTYPKGKKTPITYEIVDHRGVDDIYMKSSLGYFIWERVTLKKDELSFVIYWWYCPPATPTDLEILDMARRLLSDAGNWHQKDDRKCDNDAVGDRSRLGTPKGPRKVTNPAQDNKNTANIIKKRKWSLFCALKHASLEKAGEYNHHNTAIQTVRFVIDDLIPGHGFAHTLMDYNNAAATTHKDILKVLDLAKERIKKEIREKKSAAGNREK